MENYSTTYAAAITMFAGTLVVFARQFGWQWAETDAITLLGALVTLAGFIWQLYHRHAQGDVTLLGLKMPIADMEYPKKKFRA